MRCILQARLQTLSDEAPWLGEARTFRNVLSESSWISTWSSVVGGHSVDGIVPTAYVLLPSARVRQRGRCVHRGFASVADDVIAAWAPGTGLAG